jgi:simple sugar transport system permease protein
MGGVFSERSGVFNIAMEGMMLTGAFVAMAVSYHTGSPVLAILAAMSAASMLGLVHAYLSIGRKGNQIVAGAALNLLALGLTSFLYRAAFADVARERVAGLPPVPIPLLAGLPLLGPIFFRHSVAVYVAALLPFAAAWVLFRTTWGLTVRAAGEEPQAADSAGVRVSLVRYLSVLCSGAMAGCGGAVLVLSSARYFTQGMTAGRGFIVLGAIVFGRWHPIGVALACLFFGAADALQLRVQALGGGVPHQFLVMLPYVLTVLAMAGMVGRTAPPRYLGVPYRRLDEDPA